MSKKSAAIAERIRSHEGGEFDPHYLGYFDCFNRQQFYEAHDVLEELWLEDRKCAEGDFYKGLIQLAGAFIHLQKHRPQPALALLRLAESNLRKYQPARGSLDLIGVCRLIKDWEKRIGESKAIPQLLSHPPQLKLT